MSETTISRGIISGSCRCVFIYHRTMWYQLQGLACNIEMRMWNLSIIEEHLPFLLDNFISSIV